MISQIFIKNVATYDSTGIKIDNLEKVNYFYGSNGSGKTTISEVLRDKNQYPDCHIKQIKSDHKILVYNRNFVDENFRQDESIKGIFTLGKDQKDTIEKIEDKNKDKNKHRERIDKLEKNLRDKKIEKESNYENFKKACWEIKNEYYSSFKEIFTGYNNSKDKLAKKFQEEASNKKEIQKFDDLVQRRKKIFERSLVIMHTIPFLPPEDKVQDISILETKIIGTSDVDISNLINKLNISDWVLQGQQHMHNTDGICPFCQQQLPEDLDTKLRNYFDQTYSDQISRLKNFLENYREYTESLTHHIRKLINTKNEYLDNNKIEDTLQLLQTKIEENINLIERKLTEPSRVIELQDINEEIVNINNEIIKANELIKDNNNLVTNSKTAKKVLTEEIWRYLIEKNKFNYDTYKSKDDQLSKTRDEMQNSLKDQYNYENQLREEISQLQQQVTNIEHSVNEINKRLRSFGFTNFKLATATEEGYYKIVRENGEDAENTLSEGEKTFITFLYFYNLLKGSTNSEDITTKKIVVLDDPISSLDSNILFIVSNLIREIIEEVIEETGETKQLILLTHNVYFHKEVSFKRHTQSLKDESFWIIRKTDNKSYIQQYNENPIKSSYELLWKELILLRNQSLIATQNVMRRILENYFTFFGGMNLIDVVNKFDDEEKAICRSLLTWLHDGSHHVNEDLFVEKNEDIALRYLEVFKQIFCKTGHISHYEMMMKNVNSSKS